jgi:hypothetical protein
MENKFKEKHKLPLTFNYIELIRKTNTEKENKNIIYFISCKKYQTDFYVREKPFKPLTRML